MSHNVTETETERFDQQSAFLKLPSEIRPLIYPFALQNLAEEIRAAPLHAILDPGPQRPAMVGVLALFHTSSLLRSECSDTLRSLVQLERFQVRRAPKWDELAEMANAEAGNQGDIDGRMDAMRDVKYIVERVYWSVQGEEVEEEDDEDGAEVAWEDEEEEY
jgi:hypothetical protein